MQRNLKKKLLFQFLCETKDFASSLKHFCDFTYDELERLYIPRRIEMENITNEVKAKEFINKVKEIYRKSKLKEEYNETLRKE